MGNVPIKCKVRNLIAFLSRIQGKDQAYVTNHARSRGIQSYEFTKQEFQSLRKQAIRNKMDEDVVDQFAEAFCYIHQCPNWIRKGTFNSISGWGLDAAVQNYAAIADAIELGEKSVQLRGRFAGFYKPF